MFRRIKKVLKELLSPTILLVKHVKVSTGDVKHKVFFKAHFLASYLEITEPYLTQGDKTFHKYFYASAKQEAYRLNATLKTKEKIEL